MFASRNTIFAHGQKGMALATALIFLLILTILGVAAMNTTALQEKMATNLKDKNVALQAAESALIGAERWLHQYRSGKRSYSFPPFRQAATDDGLHFPTATGTPIWQQINWSTDTDVLTHPNVPMDPGTGLPTAYAPVFSPYYMYQAPRYIVEQVQDIKGKAITIEPIYQSPKRMYRITAIGYGSTPTATAMAQSTFIRQ